MKFVDTYYIHFNENENKIEVIVGDKMTFESSANFQKEYTGIINSIDTTNTILEIDCNQMGVLTPDLAKELKGVFEIYKRNVFKAIKIIIDNDVILTMQLERLARKVGIDCEFVTLG